MPRAHTAESTTTPATTIHDRPARIYPIENLLTIQTLMKKLNLTPGDCLSLLAEMLEDLDRQITDHEAEGDGLPFPPM